MLLDQEQLQIKTNEYLEGMRNARRDERFKGASDISRSIDQSSTKSSNGDGARTQSDEGNTAGTRGSNPVDTSGTRSSKSGGGRYGSFLRRLGYSNTGSPEGNDPVAKPIGFEPIDQPKISLPPSFKLPDMEEVKTTFASKNKPLSQSEALKLAETLPACLIDYGMYADRAIHHISKVEHPIDIWSDLTLDEAKAICNILIRKGMTSGYAAELVRTISNTKDYVTAGVVILPRFIKSVEELRQMPRQRKIK